MVYVFLAICREDCVGAEDLSSKRKLVHEICKIVLSIEEEIIAPGKGKVTDTPDKLYAQYISIVAGLPDDATMWLITLCSAYLSALTTNLKDKMDEGEFIMPALSNIITKASQIKGLRVVSMAAVKAHKAMQEEEKRIRHLFSQMKQSRGRDGGSMNHYEGSDDNYNHVRNDNHVFFITNRRRRLQFLVTAV